MEMFLGRMDLAVEYGADVAIFLHNLAYWVERNAANGRHFHDGRYWTYNTMEAFSRLYPLWSRDQIKRIIKRCEDLGLIVTGNYNEDRRDRTKWYSPSDEILELYGLGEIAKYKGRKRHLQAAKPTAISGEIAPALPKEYQEDTTYTPLNPPEGERPTDKGTKGARRQRCTTAKSTPDWKPDLFAAFWNAYPLKVSKQAAIAAWDTLRADDALLEQLMSGLSRAKKSRLWMDNVGIPYPSTWLNQRRWEDEAPGAIEPAPPTLAPERTGWD